MDSPPQPDTGAAHKEQATKRKRGHRGGRRRGKASKFDREIQALQVERSTANIEGHSEYVGRLTEKLQRLDVEARRLWLEEDHASKRRRLRRLGISVDEWVRIVARYDRAHSAAPDENPAASGSPYRGTRWRSTLGRGGKGAMAR